MAKRIVVGGKVYYIVQDMAFTDGDLNKARGRFDRLKAQQAQAVR